MAASDTASGRQAFWAAPPLLPTGLRLQHQEAIAIPRRGRGGESTLDVARLTSPSGSVVLLLAYRSAPTPRDVLLTKALLAKASDQLRLRGRDAGLLPVLAADVASPAVVDLCLREGLGVVDRTGTVVLHQGPFFVHVLGTSRIQRDQRVRLFSGRARRVVRTLLVRPGERRAVRVIAEAAGVSFAFAFRVLGRLEREGFVERPSPRGGFALRDGAGLLRAWAASPDGSSSGISRYYAPNTRPEALARAAAAAAEQGVHVHFTLASGLLPEEVFVAGLPHGAYLSGDDRAFREALALEETTPHNFWILRGDPAGDVGPGGVAEGARALPYGSGVSLPQLAVDVAVVPARGLDAMERLLDVFARHLPLLPGAP
jgi:hypothetical protein